MFRIFTDSKAPTPRAKVIALYFPQFHVISENNAWWGEGFTDWNSVRTAVPQFEGHYQPRVPLNGNYYDQSRVETLRWQVDLARKHGIYGFCHYHYWFEGKQLLETPTNLVLENKDIDFPFCLSWANETWSRRWDGRDHDILIRQTHIPDKERWKKHYDYLIRAWSDPRAIKVDGKSVFVIYRPQNISDIDRMLAYWRELAQQDGLPGLYFIFQKQYELPTRKSLQSFDALFQFQPFEVFYRPALDTNAIWGTSLIDIAKRVSITLIRGIPEHLQDMMRGVRAKFSRTPTFHNYDATWRKIIGIRPDPALTTFPGAFVDWDNAARYKHRAMVFRGASPESFRKWFSKLVDTVPQRNLPENFIFLNAWNEWSEGAYLEPDERYGYRYLEALGEALNRGSRNVPQDRETLPRVRPKLGPVLGARVESKRDVEPPAGDTRPSILGSSLWNLAGTALPLFVGLLTIPPLLGLLGIERFGLLSLIWMLTGYFGLLDMGLSRALTKVVAEKQQTVREDELSRHVWTGLVVMCGVGTLGGLVLGLLSDWLARGLLNIPEPLHTEAIGAIWFLAASIPVAIATAGLRGVMEGLQLFKAANMIRIPLAALTFLAPLAVAAFITPDLALVSASLLAVRLLGLLVHWIGCVRALPSLARPALPDRVMASLLLGFGGWLTVTNIVGPLMTYLDRFVIGSMSDLASVAYYATPYDLVMKLLLVPYALTGVLFSIFSGTLPRGGTEPARLMARSLAVVFAVLFPAVVITIAFAQEGLGLWLGDEFASRSYRVLQWLAAGVLVNAMAQVPFAYVQGAGRPDWIARLHLAELPFYVAGLWWMLGAAGIVGAAIVWTARATIDAIVLLCMANFATPTRTGISGRLVIAFMLGALALLCTALVEGALARAMIVLLSATALPTLVWRLFSFGHSDELVAG